MKSTISSARGGRPPKFDEPSRRITVTLPNHTLEDLSAISPDRAFAITKATSAAVGRGGRHVKAVEVVEMIPGHSLIVVGPSPSLSRIPWLSLVEIAPARFLLAIPSGTAVEALEVAIADAIEKLPEADKSERPMLEELHSLISRVRRASIVSKAELLIVKTV